MEITASLPYFCNIVQYTVCYYNPPNHKNGHGATHFHNNCENRLVLSDGNIALLFVELHILSEFCGQVPGAADVDLAVSLVRVRLEEGHLQVLAITNQLAMSI